MKKLRLNLCCGLASLWLILLISPMSLFAQNAEIKIKVAVKEADGQPLPGVSVKIKGTNQGTQTDLEGKFSLNASPSATLVFSIVGFVTKEEPIGNKVSISVIMTPNNASLSEVVVIGYGAQRKADVTSAVSTVKSENFVTGPVTDAGTLLKGKVAGLSISNPSGDPNAQSQILLRGTNTINGANTGVLVIIDGVPGDLLTVAPEDIAEMSVLKDGSSAAIYGVRGSNGVIIITTKRAKGDKINRIDYSGSESVSQLTRTPKLLTADDYRAQIAAGLRDPSYDKGSSTDWIKAISKDFPVSSVHNLSFTGGNDQTNYLASANYRFLNGIFQQSNHGQFTGRVDINHTTLGGKLKFNLGILQTNFNDIPFAPYDYRQALIMNPTAPVKMPDGSYYQEPTNFQYQNPVSDLYNTDQPQTSFRSKYNATVTLLPVSGLRIAATGSYTKSGYQNLYYANSQNISTLRDNQNGVANISTGQTVERFLNISAEYSKAFGDHRFTVLGGYEYQDYDYFNSGITNHNFPTDQFGYNQIQLGTAQKDGQDFIISGRTQTNLISYFARGTYNYKEKYLLLASLRIDGASQLYGASEPYGKFPSVQAGWRITKESFMQNQHIFDDLKLRAGYGVTGNQPAAGFLAVGLLGYGNYILYNGQWIQTLSPSQNANPSLRWEEKHETDIGLDYSILKGFITGSVDYYDRKIKGLLYSYNVPSPPNLYPTTMANVGTMENKGVEVTLNITPIKNKNFNWTSTFTFSTNTNKLVSLSNDLYQATVPYFTTGYTGDPIQTFTSIVQVGHNIGDFYGYKVTGVSKDGYWIYQEPDGTSVPYDKFGHSFNDKQIIGNGLPKYYGGWNNSIAYKNWDFSVTMRGAFDYQVINFQRMYYENPGIINYNRLKSAYDPVFGTAVLNKNVPLEYNSYYVENGDFWKVDNINLGYTFRNLKAKYIHNPRVAFSMLNAFVITGYKGIDPEVDRSGLAPGIDQRDTYPTLRTYTISLSASF
ncbi:SusC/RagA family TonB-linked outer membrane protein [Mucilaginibacter agri]|uniref:SusC/RagA family TonB-linked outer membrane protein n=1 Tax=Mucilaginibacter agri TaxID=2695265 RepID=A0A966DSB0_9SPHI|nr:SusC/RagA family TonB-linked outer membrane protein [Mucilaginibacter agri]NCD68141.1 SusC/RagA family TonB-linked outer membrane protein [Mucilaginibacter agri]